MNSPVSIPRDEARPNAQIYEALRDQRIAEISRHKARSAKLSVVRLVTFLGGGTLVAFATMRGGLLFWLGSALVAGMFVGAVLAQQVTLRALDEATLRRDLLSRHLLRLTSGFVDLPSHGAGLVPPGHPYAWDIDLLGPGSLYQRLDVTQTVEGSRILATWLAEAASLEEIAARQQAVLELAALPELREDLEAAGLLARGDTKLDGSPFLEFATLPAYVMPRPWLAVLIWLLPLLTLACYLLGLAHRLPVRLWLVPLAAQVAVLFATAKPVRHAFDLAAARQGAVEAFERMLRVVEGASFTSPRLQALKERLTVSHTPASTHMRSLRSWTSLAELRQQALFYLVFNPLTLWDLHVLHGLERWNARAGRQTADWFTALGELEALSSLAVLAFGDPGACMPEVVPAGGSLYARGLAHPLLIAGARVPNDLDLPGPGCAIIVTGSNMAGKSTLLRALGLNVALALAGGPVCADAMQVPLIRLRASMRTEDSLQRGASYFQAELLKLRTVAEGADKNPPLLFLLDELLRGTNARARHLGARAVLLHLLRRSAMGVCATHDIALSALEDEYKGRIRNLHFTDVVQHGEMRFDYRLRPGVVRTSNALRLLAMAGIDVPDEDKFAIEAPEVPPSQA